MNDKLNKDGQIIQQNAQPQIYHAINFLANYFVRFLPKAKCRICDALLIQKIEVKKGKEDHKFPDRPFCGHWVHQGCLIDVLSEPPFKTTCGAAECGEDLQSNRHPNDQQHCSNREKVWTQTQQKAAEEDDIDKLFGI